MLARMTSKGQITIPLQVRKVLGLKEGSFVSFTLREGKAELVPIQQDVLALRGSVKVSAPQDFKKVEEEVRRKVAGYVASEGEVR